MGERPTISVRGARVHNLRGVDVDLPRGALVALTGPSGSGKSSLAFDTLYAEAQRRFVDSLALDARAALELFARPDVDVIEGLPPALAVPQRPPPHGPRATVATLTEVHDYLRLLFARVGRVSCPNCGVPIVKHTVPQLVDEVLALAEGARVAVLAPVARARVGDLADEIQALRREGYVRVNLDGALVDLSAPVALDPLVPHTLEVWVDRVVVGNASRGRVAEAIEAALRLAEGRVRVALVDAQGALVDARDYADRALCLRCDRPLPELQPRLFSFTSPHGACPRCDGSGGAPEIDAARVVGDATRSLLEGAVLPWAERVPASAQAALTAASKRWGFDLNTPWCDIAEAAQRFLLFGDDAPTAGEPPHGARPKAPASKKGARAALPRYGGLIAELRAAMTSPDTELDPWPYVSDGPCGACAGKRLRPEALAVHVGGRDIAQVLLATIDDARVFLASLVLEARESGIAERLLRDLQARLRFLSDAGVGYLALDRGAGTLSGGEAQRIRLATALGSSLVGMLYVLDEPTTGLHARDVERLLRTLRGLCDAGNTVLVVEHDAAVIRASDYVVDVGPGAGAEGGRVVAVGTPAEVARVEASPTGRVLAGREVIPLPRARRPAERFIELRGASGHNLRDVDARFPLGCFTCVTGVSGSGKSSLVADTLLPAVRRALGLVGPAPLPHRALVGAQPVARVVEVDATPIGRTPRSTPASYTGIAALLRELFAELPEARVRGFGVGRFSFNQKGGRCEACEGDGVSRVAMGFLPDVFVRCERCEGQRFDRETLQVRYRGLSIADVLALSVDAAFTLFSAHPKLHERLSFLRDVGLGYLPLGQGANTLSGGEAQRLKLARELARKSDVLTLYVLDEPTTGLHAVDVRRLLEVLGRIVDAGHTVIVVEHDLDVAKSADWLVDLGEGGGPDGGRVLAMGTPEAVCADLGVGFTARYLAPRLQEGARGAG